MSTSNIPTCISTYDDFYQPLAKRTINFGDNVSIYKDISSGSNYVYAKTSEEGKSYGKLSLIETGYNGYEIHACQKTNNE